jgi:DNA-binding MarR family transcriptional regulator
MVETEPQVGELAGEMQRVLSKVFSVLRRGDSNRTVAGDLTLAQLSILLTLLDQGPIRMTELAAHERVRTPTTTVAIRRLEKLGLVKRSRDPSDLRAVLVDITPKGLAQPRRSRDPDQGAGPAGATGRIGRINRANQAPRRRSTTAACCPAVRR